MEFGILNTLVPSHYILQQQIRLSLLHIACPWNMYINENVQPPVDCEMGTNHSAIFFLNLGKYIV